MPNRCIAKMYDGIMPDPDINLLEWANTRFQLPRESTSEYGQFRSSRTPMVEDILLELSPQSKTQVAVLVKPAQFAGTTVVTIFLLGMVCISPGPSLCIMPTDTKARSFSKKRLATSIKLMPDLSGVIQDTRTRDSGNTILEKTYPGGNILLTGANSGASYRQESIKYLVLDDFDDFELDIEGEGSSDELADRRTGSFPGRKIYINSTPTTKGDSNIERVFENSSQGFFNIPCPICGFYQYLVWGEKDGDHGIKFERDEAGEIIDVYYVCINCHGRIDETDKPWMAENGVYIHKYPSRKTKGFIYSGLLTPHGWVNDWEYIARKYVEAAAAYKTGNPAPMKTWKNTLMAEWYEPAGDRNISEIDLLKDDRPSGLVPSEGVNALIGGIDTQDDGFWYVIRGYGAFLESWLINYGFIDSLEGLEKIIFGSTYKDVAGNEYPVAFSFQDAMGHRTAEVYEFIHGRAGIFASQGVPRKGPTITISKINHYPGTNKEIPGGIKLARVNSSHYKDFLSTKIKVNPALPGAFHLHSEIASDYKNQMTAEFINEKGLWECPKNKANHLWDCEYLCLAAADYMGVKDWKMTPDARKTRVRAEVGTGGRLKGRKINPWKK